MGTSRTEAAGAAPASESRDRSAGARLRELLRVSGADDDPAGAEQLAELEQEVALLREENARLKIARQHAGDRPVNERVRAALPLPQGEGAADADDPWEALTECMLLRETLLDACRELEQGAAELRARLETLLADDVGAAVRPSDDFEGVT